MGRVVIEILRVIATMLKYWLRLWCKRTAFGKERNS